MRARYTRLSLREILHRRHRGRGQRFGSHVTIQLAASEGKRPPDGRERRQRPTQPQMLAGVGDLVSGPFLGLGPSSPDSNALK